MLATSFRAANDHFSEKKKKICEDIIHIGHMLYFLKHHSEQLECWFQDKVWDVEKTILVQDLNVFIFKVIRET